VAGPVGPGAEPGGPGGPGRNEGCGLSDFTVDSPATDEIYTPNPDALEWDYRVSYEVWVAQRMRVTQPTWRSTRARWRSSCSHVPGHTLSCSGTPAPSRT
jgi:hypothetical protein